MVHACESPSVVPSGDTFPSNAILDGLADGIVATDAGEGVAEPLIVYVNQAACDITGYAADELLGRSPKMLQGPSTDRAVMRRLREDLEAGRPFSGQTVNYRKDGTEFVMEWSISTVAGPDGRPRFFVAVQRDATLPARRLLDAEREARMDTLTGLPNRSHIDSVLDGGGWLTTRAHSAVVVDVDHFKAINDRYGHLIGDEVLRQVAQRIAGAARQGDLVARWGGEEFCILMLGDGDRAAAVARRVVEAVSAQSLTTSAGEIRVTVSAGSAALDEDCCSATDLLRAADEAMYHAKQQGRNRAQAGRSSKGVDVPTPQSG